MAEGFIEVRGAQLFFRTVGRGRALLFLHGGPAARHNYFLPWVRPLAAHSKLVFYDQRGSGRSSKSAHGRYPLATMVEDVEMVRRRLGLGKIDLLGHSWGGLLAEEYALTHPTSLHHLILADTFSSGRELNRRLKEMRVTATARQRAIIERYEKRGLFRDGDRYPKEYERVANEVYAP